MGNPHSAAAYYYFFNCAFFRKVSCISMPTDNILWKVSSIPPLAGGDIRLGDTGRE